ncbi:MAG TPA: hypothetical protein VL654_05905, partial [Casimicrobiaceae bacterium]|nr:hypothetical protein [Casimicrobiaceae bacterium]
AFSQNFTANQPDDRALGIAKAFAVADDNYNLMASSRGLELYAYRLDPGNHCNLLEFFDSTPDGGLALRAGLSNVNHFRAALPDNPRAVAHVDARFRTLRDRLSARVAAKRAYIEAAGVQPTYALDPRMFDVFARAPVPGGAPPSRPAAPPAMAPFEFSFKLSP